MRKEVRERVWNMYDKKCAYCGCDLPYKKMQVDHIKPLYRNDKLETLTAWGVERGKDEESNYHPSCARCNRWKSTFSLEQFRGEIEKQVERLKRDSSAFRMAHDYDRVIINDKPVKFYFEEFNPLIKN